MIIKEFLDDSGTWISLITRPRRFGKTLNMSMMAEFFDITKDSKDIFADTKIMEMEYASFINQYPTIFLSFANAKGTKQNTINSIKDSLRELYGKYDYIFINMKESEESSVEFLDNIIDSLLYEDKTGFFRFLYHDLTSENSYHML